MNKIIISLFLIAVPFVSVHAASFDCSKARSYSEKEICSKPELSKKDDLLSALYKKAKAATQDKQAFSSIQNALWLSRERCENTLCLTAWYDSAFAIYEAIHRKGIPTTIGTPTPKGDALTAPESHENKFLPVDTVPAVLGNAQASESYCAGLSGKECESIKAADATLKKQPSYCKDGFALPDNPYKLSRVQVRICDITWDRGVEKKQSEEDKEYNQYVELKKENDKRYNEYLESQNRQIEDAKALIREDTAPYIELIQQIQMGYSCEIINDGMAMASISKLDHWISMDIARAGLIGEPSIQKEIAGKMKQARDTGKAMANNGACEEISPANRARLVQTTLSLIN